MHRHFDRERHSRIVDRLALSSSVGQCLAYEDMVDVPPGFDHFAHAHFSARHAGDGSAWRDMCPAYALALMAHGAYALPGDDAEMEALWQELAPSRLDWRQVRGVVADAWEWLERSGPRVPS